MFRFLLTLFSLSLLLTPVDTSATMTQPLSLHEIVKQSGKAFWGRCTSVEVAWDERGLPATFISFEVIHPIKGVDSDVVTIKQFGDTSVSGHGVTALSHGVSEQILLPRKNLKAPMIGYTPGEEVVVFLYRDSPIGFTSPVGYGQGLFRVQEESSGRPSVANSFANHFLKLTPTQMSVSALTTGPLSAATRFDLDAFLDLVETMVTP